VPTVEWAELVQGHNDPDVYQPILDDVPVIDIRMAFTRLRNCG
jgi:hypothetical protein